MKPKLIALMVAALVSCGRGIPETPEIASEAKEGATNLVFKIQRREHRPDGSQTLSLDGLLQGRPVGFDVELSRWIENPPGFVNMSTWQATVRLKSRGEPSDELLRFIDTLYGTHVSPNHMLPSAEFEALSPWEDPGGIESGSVKLVLFAQPGFDERDYAEIWLEIDASDGVVRLREKETRYRRAFVQLLCAEE